MKRRTYFKFTAYLILILSIPVLVFQSCSDDVEEVVPAEQDHDYYPLAIGVSQTYQVDSIHFDGFTKTSDTFQYKVRHTVVDTNTDLLDRFSYLVLREIDTGTGFDIDRQYTVVRTSDALETIYDDERVVNLRFPVDPVQRWDGNIFNSKDREIFRYLSVDEPKEVLDSTFSQTATVEELERENIIEDYLWTTTYAREVGMVERFRRNIARKNTQGVFEQGYITHYRLLSFER